MVVGLWITQIIPNPFISLPLAFASHMVLDAIPHNDYFYFQIPGNFKHMHESPLSIVLLGVGGFLTMYLALHTPNPIIASAGAFMGLLPDAIWAISKRMSLLSNGLIKKINWFHQEISHTTFDLGEAFHNLGAGRKVSFPTSFTTRKENFMKISDSALTKLGWFVESGIEVGLCLYLSIWVLLK